MNAWSRSKNQGWLRQRQPCGIQSRDKTLTRGLLITRRPVDLTGEEQTLDPLDHQAAIERSRVDIVVLDRIAGTKNYGLFETLDRLNVGFLDGGGQGRRNPVGINRVVGQTLRLQEHLMRGPILEAYDLVLDRGTVSRADARDPSTMEPRASKVRADHGVSPAICFGDPATHLTGHRPGGEKGQEGGIRVSRLFTDPRPVDAGGGKPRWRSGLETTQR